MFPTTPHKEGAELYAISRLPSTPNTAVKHLFAASPREPLRVSKLLAAYPDLRTVVVRELHVDAPLGDPHHPVRLFIFDELVVDDCRFMHNVTHLHIDVAAAHSFHEFCKAENHRPRQTFVNLRYFSIALHIEDATAGHYDALIAAVVGCSVKFTGALVHVFYGSREDPWPDIEPSFTFGATRFVPEELRKHVYHVLRHALYHRDAVELWKRNAWKESRGVWHNAPPPYPGGKG